MALNVEKEKEISATEEHGAAERKKGDLTNRRVKAAGGTPERTKSQNGRKDRGIRAKGGNDMLSYWDLGEEIISTRSNKSGTEKEALY